MVRIGTGWSSVATTEDITLRCEGCGRRCTSAHDIAVWSRFASGCSLECTIVAIQQRHDVFCALSLQDAPLPFWVDDMAGHMRPAEWVRIGLHITERELERLRGLAVHRDFLVSLDVHRMQKVLEG